MPSNMDIVTYYTVPFFNAGHRDVHAKNLGPVNELFSRNF
jgi:hypothetical protein